MQDDDLKYMGAHADLRVTEIACKSMQEGGSLWRKLAANGALEKASNSTLKEFLFAALASPDVDTAREFMTQAFANKDPNLLISFFHKSLFVYESTSQLCDPSQNEQLKIENLPVVLEVLNQCGVDMAVNTIHRVIDYANNYANIRRDQNQEKLIEVACAYLDRGASIYNFAAKPESSPLAWLLSKKKGKGLDVLATWAEALISRGHIQETHLRAVEGVESIDPQALALFEACLARHSIMGISRAAQTLRA